jgi:hypothetical protein
MASSGIQLEKPPTGGMSMVVAKGAVYHMLGPLVAKIFTVIHHGQ